MPLISEYEVEISLRLRMTASNHLHAVESALVKLQELDQRDIASIDVKKV